MEIFSDREATKEIAAKQEERSRDPAYERELAFRHAEIAEKAQAKKRK